MESLVSARTASIIMLVCYLSACAKSSPEEILALGKERLERNDYVGARLEFKRALQEDPRLAQGRVLLAKVDVALGLGAEAEEEFKKALELGVPRESVLVHLTRARLLSGNNAKIVEEAKSAGDENGSRSAADDADLQALRGHAYYFTGDPATAKSFYERALKLVPDNSEARFGLIRLASTPSTIPVSKKQLEEFLTLQPRFAPGWGLLADWELSEQHPDAAANAYTKAIGASPNNYGYRIGRLYVWATNGKCDLVRQELPGFGDKKKRDPRVSLVDGLCNMNAGQLNEARESFLAAVALAPDYGVAQLGLGSVCVRLKQYEQADEALNVARRNPALRVSATKILAFSHLARDDAKGAEKILSEMSRENPDDPEAAILLGKFALARGKQQEGIDYFQKAVGQQPNSAEAFLNLGVAFNQTGAADKSRQALEKALAIKPSLKEASYQLVAQSIAAKKFDDALARVGELQQQDSKDPIPHNLEGLIYLEQSKVSDARAAFRRALELSPNYVAAALNLANLEIAQKNLPEADKVLSTALKGHPTELTATMRLAEIKVMAGRPEDAISILRVLSMAAPNAVQPRIVLARLLTAGGNGAESLSVARQAGALDPKNPAVLTELGKAALVNGMRDEAISAFERLVAVAPDSALSHFLLADANFGRSLDKTRTELQTAVRLDPTFAPATLALTKVYLASNELKAAADLLAELEKQHPDSPDVLLSKAEIALRKGDYGQAEELYADGVKRFPKLADPVLGISRTRWVAGKKEQSLEPLLSWLKDSPQDVRVLNRLGDSYAELGNEAKARETFEALLKLSPDEPAVLNRLAWLLRDENPEQALEYAEKGATRAPGDPAVADTYGYLLVRKGKTELALKVLEKAAEQIPAEPAIRYHLALAYAAAGKREHALTEVTAALKSDRPFGERDAARKFLADLSAGK